MDQEDEDVPFEPKVHEEESLMHIPLSDDQQEDEYPAHIPPTMDPKDVSFEPNVHEEESLMHDVDLMIDDDVTLRDGRAEA